MEEMRLNKYLSEMGICSRREADRLIEAGKVSVDGTSASMGMKVSPGQAVRCNGKVVGGNAGTGKSNGKSKDEATGKSSGKSTGKAKPVLMVVNKPRGIVCTTSNKDKAVNIVDFLHYPTRLYPVGRLDKDSEGLIFMTNQGDLVNKIMRSSNVHEKEYTVTVDKPLTKTFLTAMAEGVPILDTVTRPCVIQATGKREFTIILTQGLNRQIRRMCEHLGYQVRTLKRVRIMNIRLGNLKTGDCRRVTPAEYAQLKEMLEIEVTVPKESQDGKKN